MAIYLSVIQVILLSFCYTSVDLRTPTSFITPVQLIGSSGSCLLLNNTNIDLMKCFDPTIIYDRFVWNSYQGIIHHSLNPLNDHVSLSTTCFNGSEKCLLVFIDHYTNKFLTSINMGLVPINIDTVSILSSQPIVIANHDVAIDLIYVYSITIDDRKSSSKFLRYRLIMDEHFKLNNATILSQIEDKSSSLPKNIFSFIYADYAYFLRVKNGKLRYENERSLFLDRICMNDVKNGEFRSYISSFLFEIKNNSDDNIVVNYEDERKMLRIFFENNEELDHYSLIEYNMTIVHEEINGIFFDCYNNPNAFDIAILTPFPKTCRVYRMYEDRYKPCGVDLCSPTSCALNGRFHIESYRNLPFNKKFSQIITNVVYSRGSNGGVQQIFIIEEDILLMNSKDIYGSYIIGILLTAHPPKVFHVSTINGNNDSLIYPAMALINDTVIVINENEVKYIALDCSIIDSCSNSLLIRNSSIFANCGWCYKLSGGSFSSSKELCLLGDKDTNIFLNEVCLPEIDCFENDYINSSISAPIHFRGFFPWDMSLNATVCGVQCRIISFNESRISCQSESLPLEENILDGHCSIELETVFRNESFKINPKCSKKLLLSTLPIIEQVTQNDDILRDKANNLIIFLTFSTLLFVFAFVCAAYRKTFARKKRETDPNSHWYNTLPLRPFEFLSHRMNSYVPEPGTDAYCSIERLDGSYDDLSYLVPDNVRIPWSTITKAEMIGMGHFGEVYKGIYTQSNGCILIVAIKTLRIGARNVKQFVDEGIRMELFDHKNVLSLVGITFNESNYPMIVTPFMVHGDLLSYLRNSNNSPTVRNLLEFGIDVIEGLKYLHQMRYIHRDLAARNCMLDENLCVKVADFGLSRDVYESEFYLSVNLNTDIPIRWLPPESIERQEYSAKSDVWSYGVTLWELMTRGLTPYSHLTGYRLLDYVKSGHRLPMPKMCPVEIFELMKMCWHPKPNNRPDSSEVSVRLKVIIKMLESDAPSYYNMQTCLESMSQYEVPCSLNDAGRQQE